MRLSDASIALTYAILASNGVTAYSLSHPSTKSNANRFGTRLSAETKEAPILTEPSPASYLSSLSPPLSSSSAVATPSSPTFDYEAINRLTFRELQKACKERDLSGKGNTLALRNTLLDHMGIINPMAAAAAAALLNEECTPDGIEFCDESDPYYEYNLILSQINEASKIGHWKSATRKLKKLARRYANNQINNKAIPRETYVSVLKCCLEDRLHGARAAEPARKILEEMSHQGYPIPPELGNMCVVSCLGGRTANGSHEGFGGIDTALAMLAALEATEEGSKTIESDT